MKFIYPQCSFHEAIIDTMVTRTPKAATQRWRGWQWPPWEGGERNPDARGFPRCVPSSTKLYPRIFGIPESGSKVFSLDQGCPGGEWASLDSDPPWAFEFGDDFNRYKLWDDDKNTTDLMFYNGTDNRLLVVTGAAKKRSK